MKKSHTFTPRDHTSDNDPRLRPAPMPPPPPPPPVLQSTASVSISPNYRMDRDMVSSSECPSDATSTTSFTQLSTLSHGRPGDRSRRPHPGELVQEHDQPIICESVKRYKNSPFGLKRHYLTLPDSPRPGGSYAAADDEDESDSEDLIINNHHRTASKRTRDIESALDHERSQFADYDMPAGDLGLDARKCLAKDAERIASECDVGKSNNCESAARANNPTACGNNLMLNLGSVLYACFLVIVGCLLHVAEMRQKTRGSSGHVYATFVALVGFAWLLFLHADLQRYKRFASRYILSETENRKQGSPSISDSSASLINDQMSMNTEFIFKKTAHKMHHQRSVMAAQQKQAHRGISAQSNARPTSGSIHSGSQSDSHKSASVCTGDPLASTTALECDGLIPAYKFVHGKMGANFYLKCGMAAFCFGHVIHEGLRFGQQLYFFTNGPTQCRDSAAMVSHLVIPLYSFYQLFMMFKYSNLVINRFKILARFGLMHIIGTSITFWFRTILEEAFHDFVHKMDYFRTKKPHRFNQAVTRAFDSNENVITLLSSVSNAIRQEAQERSFDFSPVEQLDANITMDRSFLSLMSSPVSETITPELARHLPDSYGCSQNALLTSKSMDTLPYLYPFTIEYNLIVAATFLSIFFHIGKIGSLACGTPACSKLSGTYTNNTTCLSSCSSSTKTGTHKTGSINGSNGGSSICPPPTTTTTNALVRLDEVHSDKDVGEYKSNFVVNADCHSANKGLFCGFFVLLVTLVTIVIFFVTIKKPSHVHLGIKINLVQEAMLTTLILIVTLAAFKQVVKLNRNPHLKDKVTTDDVLMLIPLPFFFIHSLLSFRAETAHLFASSTYGGTINAIGSPVVSSSTPLPAILLQNNHTLNNTVGSQRPGTIRFNNSVIIASDNSGFGVTGHRPAPSLIPRPSPGTSPRPVPRPVARPTSRPHSNQKLVSHPNITNSPLLNDDDDSNDRIELDDRIPSRPVGIGNDPRSADMPGSGDGGGRVRRHSNDEADDNDNDYSNSDNNIRGIGVISMPKNRTNNTGAKEPPRLDHFKLITVALNFLVMIEVLVQTNFIIDGMRRCSESRYLRFKKPGRELITFAILLNITYWIVATFETKSVEQYKTEIEYYGPLPYMFISHTTLPVMLFYRYHSSVCLAEIWNHAYKPPKKH